MPPAPPPVPRPAAPPAARPELSDVRSLEELYPRLAKLHITAGWNKPQPSLYPEPKRNFHPVHWRWSECRAAMQAAGRLIDTELAERRNLVLYNPVDPDRYATTRTLVAAYQMILPGEHARSHRHSPHALRLVLEGEGAYTVVDGQRLEMSPGDVVLTPGSCWHGHGNDGDAPCYWLDGLDVPLAHLLEPVFLEPHPAGFAPVEGQSADSPYLFRWQDSLRRLDAGRPDPEGVHGIRVELGNPALPTAAVYMERLPAGFETRPKRTTANQLFCPVEGRGETAIDGERFRWEPGDVLAVPCWRPFHHRAESDATLFCMTDEPLQRHCRYLRTEVEPPAHEV